MEVLPATNQFSIGFGYDKGKPLFLYNTYTIN